MPDGPGHRHLDDGRLAAAAALAQHRQIAHVVGHFVRQHSQGRDDTQSHVGHESRGNQNTVAKAMHAVASQHRPLATPHAFAVLAVAMPMAVVVVLR
jgi:hypothetical protein